LTEVFEIGNFIDSFALGHYARVLDAVDKRTGQTVAFKIMRPEHRHPQGAPKWEAQAFPHEARLLSLLKHHRAPMKIFDCGYTSAIGDYPSADGELVSYGQDVMQFSAALYEANAAGWRPYLALENLPRNHSLLYVMQSTQGQRRRLPTEEGLDLAWQFGDLLRFAHGMGIYYMDHKLEHIYWDGQTLRVIDWNSSKLLENVLLSDQQRRKDIHNLCVGVLYPVFTGLSSQRGALKPQPGNQAEVDARYDQIRHLDFGVDPSLSSTITSFLESGAQQKITSAEDFLTRLEKVSVRFGWHNSSPVLQQARAKTREGLMKLRQAEELARESREALLSSATMEGINEDMEAELRRLMQGIAEFLNARVIP
jgi:serine/threonine protein kinase